jgi:hypothetical protein
MDADDLALFERSLRDGFGRAGATDIDAVLLELGWDEALDDDPGTAVPALFGIQGHTGATSSALARVLSQALGQPDPPGAWAATVLPAAATSTPPGVLDGDRLRVDGLGLGGLGGSSPARVTATSADGSITVHSVPTGSLGLRAIDGVDPDLGLLRVTGDVGTDGAAIALPAGSWDGAVARGRLAIAHELVGASRAMLDLACEHARGRVQFDRPIAGFQAVRHRLAETLVAVETAAAMLEAAWLDPTPTTSSMAKAVAGRQARTTARHCQQVLAGIGFTVEHPFHRYVRRTLALDALLGTSASLTAALGGDLVDGRRLPPLLPL